jgi:signal transduction histidine kinase
MQRFKKSFRRHALTVGLLAVAIPLLASLWLQYRSLSKLESTLPTWRRAFMRRYLSQVAERVTTYYERKAEETLGVPPSAFHQEYPNKDFKENAMDLEQISAYFRQHQFKGARLLFTAIITGLDMPHYAMIWFYDPISCSYHYKPDESEWQAAHAAAANWIAMTMTNATPKSIHLTADERDPKNRIIVKPIIDENSRVVGVAGMFLNENVFINDYLAPAIRESLPNDFPDEDRDVVVTLVDAKNDHKLIFANQPFEGPKYEVGWPMMFIFTDWFLGARMRQMTAEEWGRRHFSVNLSLAILTALAIIGAVAMAMRAASRAMKLSQMKADFVSNVSHELRTPLASIRVFGEFLKLGRVKEPDKIQEYGEYIETESRRLTQLINNILDFSKIESGQKTYHFEQTAVEGVVADTLKTFEVVLEQNGFTLSLEMHSSPLPRVVIDPDAIAQAFINLLDNAVKYSGGSKAIGVKLAEHGDMVTISVVDHGVGIANEEREKVFEKFYRVGNCLVHDVKGSGLGLSIVKHIVEAHHGRVTVESEPGRGSAFTVHLPVDQSERMKIAPDSVTDGTDSGYRTYKTYRT